MNRFVLDASFTLRWCFESEVTPKAEEVLSLLQEQQTSALVPHVWLYEILNGLGKGVTRKRITQERAIALWREFHALPIRVIETRVDEELLDLAIRQNLSVYDACYLKLAVDEGLPIATGDDKLQQAAKRFDTEVVAP